MIRVFAITGTNGKTTASWMLRNILEQNGPCGMIGTIQHVIGDSCYVPENTTPGRALIKSFLDEMHLKNIEQCVIEASSHGIDQGRLTGTVLSGAGFINLSRDHLDYHNSMEQYYQAKKKLFLVDGLKSTINIDDKCGKRLYGELTALYGKTNVKSISLREREADLYGEIISQDISGSTFRLYEKKVLCGECRICMPGEHFVTDAMIAAGMARQGNVAFSDIVSGLQTMKNVPGRMEKVGSTEDTLGIVDYAHTPDGLEKLLSVLSELKKGKLICVFGCGGFRDKGKRHLMGEVAGKYCDYCIITNDNPRGEVPVNIASAIEEGLYPTGCGYCVILNRYQAIKRAVSLADKWDIIVVAGKGHESCQIYGGELIPFNDKEVLKDLLEMKYEKTYDETD